MSTRIGLAALVLGLSASASALSVTHAGRLLDSADQPVSRAGVPVAYRIYNQSTNGSPLWSSAVCAADVRDGLFSIELGTVCTGASPLDETVLSAVQERWLEVSVDGLTLAPRVAIRPVPMAQEAVHAQLADDAVRVGGQTLTALDARYLRAAAGAPQLLTTPLSIQGDVLSVGGRFTGDGSGLTNVTAINSTHLGGVPAAAYARTDLSGVTFAGGVAATAFTGSGSGLTNVTAINSTHLGGVPAATYARTDLSGVTFAGGVAATMFTGGGSGLTNVTAVNSTHLGGMPAATYARTDLSGVTFAGGVAAGTFSGDASGLTNLPAARLTGTLPDSVIPANVVRSGSGSITPSVFTCTPSAWEHWTTGTASATVCQTTVTTSGPAIIQVAFGGHVRADAGQRCTGNVMIDADLGEGDQCCNEATQGQFAPILTHFSNWVPGSTVRIKEVGAGTHTIRAFIASNDSSTCRMNGPGIWGIVFPK